ncbi:prickle-like protein 2 isoform X2 [Carassius gibelio]|uniref:prickle-like protein 2 isoform X2 n=1 Tax=Carassius gibelio TaxID=101364 RepID=UPI0022773F6E|nr:prickle-like protein 2 isoform X2 [Carassius gibelio]
MALDMERTVSKIMFDFQRNSTSDDDSGCALEEYAWVPPGLKPEQVHQYYSFFPEDKVPYVNSIGEKHRIKQLLQQLPPHDNEVRYCTSLDEEEKRELKIFSNQRKRDNLGRGTVRPLPLTVTGAICEQCGDQINGGDIAVFASRVGHGLCWHPHCFVCCVCSELLVDLIYFHLDGKIYCGRHHAERLKPRCSACDEIIFADECTEAEGQHWHMRHFCCYECDAPLGGQRYIMREGHPHCCNCFESLYAEYCDSCGEHIGIDQGQMAYEGQHWHATEECFSCARCNQSLLGCPFLPKQGLIYCSRLCSQGDETELSDSSDSAFQSARSRQSRHSTQIGKNGTKGKGEGVRQTSSGPTQLVGDPESLAVQMDLLSISSPAPSRTPHRTPTRTPSRTPSRSPSLNREQSVWVNRDEPYTYESQQRESSTSSNPHQLRSQCSMRSAYPPSPNQPPKIVSSPESWSKEQPGGNSKKPPAMAALRGHSFNENWMHHGQEPEFHAPKLKTQMSFNEVPSRNSGFLDKRSISMQGFPREMRPPLLRSRHQFGPKYGELTPVEQTPRGSTDSLALSYTTGNSLDGTNRRQEHFSRFSMPDLSKDSGVNVSDKGTMGTLNSSMQFRSTESLSSVPRPLADIGMPVRVRYPPPLYWESPRGLSFEDPVKGRIGLAGSMSCMQEGNNQAMTPRPRHTQTQGSPRQQRQRQRHHRKGHKGHKYHYRSGRSRSDNALHLATDNQSFPGDPIHRFHNDFERPSSSRVSHNQFGANHGYRQQFFRPCPRTTSDLTLQDPGGPQIGQYMGRYGETVEDEDQFCSTCSSSSEVSEDDGYLLGEVIPRPVQLRYFDNEELRHRYSPTVMGGQTQLHTRKRRKSKNCIIS